MAKKKNKILLYCPVFYPMVGGMETVTECMAELFLKEGHECIVLTPVTRKGSDNYPFKVYRNPGVFTKIKLIFWSDIVVSKGAALKLLPLVKLLFKPFIWIHSGYQASCIDGLGWVDGIAAPMTPWPSIKFHYERKGFYYAFKESIKLFLRRFASKYIVTMNVAVSDWVATRQPFPRQIRIYNPFPIFRFIRPEPDGKPDYDFVYLGRLVSEKGVKNLIEAFVIINKLYPEKRFKLLIIGDGNWRNRMERVAIDLNVIDKVDFVGRKTGNELVELVHNANIAVIPSEWEEPMGGVALELLASGRNVIVSKNGGLAECIGDAGLTFENGNSEDLADCMLRFLDDKQLSDLLKQKAKEQIQKFNPELLIKEYLDLFNKVLNK